MQMGSNVNQSFVAKLAEQAQGHAKFHREQTEEEKQRRRERAPMCGTD